MIQSPRARVRFTVTATVMTDFWLLNVSTYSHQTWQFVCHEEKLRQPGSYVTASLQGQSIFVARDNEGLLRAFYNVCQHRGHELLQGEGITSTITCPYHAWVYDLNGSLRRARRSELIENFRENDIRLQAVQVETFCHLVFVNLDPDASALAEQSGNLAQEITAYAPGSWRADLCTPLELSLEIQLESRRRQFPGVLSLSRGP